MDRETKTTTLTHTHTQYMVSYDNSMIKYYICWPTNNNYS